MTHIRKAGKGRAVRKATASKAELPKAEKPAASEVNKLADLFNQGRYNELENLARLLTENFPLDGHAWKALAAVNLARRCSMDALEPARKAVELLPLDAEARTVLGLALHGQGLYLESETCYRQALDIRPDSAIIHNNLGVTLQDSGRFSDAEASYRRALEINHDYAEAHNNLGNNLKECGRLSEAEASYRCALGIRPEYASAYSNLGSVLKDQGHFMAAEASFRRALEINPDYVEAHSNLLFTMTYNSFHSASYCLETAVGYGSMVSKKVGSIFTNWSCKIAPKCLRVGVVSGDLRNHPVSYFLESLLASLDPSRIELIAYPTSHRADTFTARIKPYFSAWRSLAGLGDAAASLIHSDGVHVLLDLSGHSAYNRLPVFAWKPAPVQVSWLGYLATTGVREIDYVLGDPVATPPEDEGNFSEKIWRLTDVWCCFTPPDIALEVGPLPALSVGHVTFGCFNNLSKMNDSVVALWARVLKAVPGSRLLLRARQLSDRSACEATLKRFEAQGVESARLMLEHSSSRSDLLETYRRVDIALDPFPYNGATTSVEALWMAVPFISRKGDRFLSRCGQSLAVNAGLSDWIADDDEDYVAKAVAHASELGKLAALRAGLRQQVLASPLFNAAAFARHFEDAIWGMWQNWCATQSGPVLQSLTVPDQNEVNKLVSLFNHGRYDEMEVLARSITAVFPKYGPGWKAIAVSLITRGRSAEALEPALKATELLPVDAESHYILGTILEDRKRYSESEASYRRALEIRPDYANALSTLSSTMASQGRLSEAEASCRQALEIEPCHAEAHNNLGNILRGQGRLLDSEACYRKALQIKPNYAEAHHNLGTIHYDGGRLQEAGESYRRALEIRTDYAGAHNSLGNVLKDQACFSEAEAHYRRALEIKPDFADAYYNLGYLLQKRSRFTEAEASYHSALEIKPDFTDAIYNLGHTLHELGRFSEAETSYRRALEIKPDYAGVLNNLGNTLVELNRLDEAEACYRSALKSKPDYAGAYNNLGNILNEQSRLSEAEANYRCALEIQSDHVEALSNLGNVLKNQGRLVEAEHGFRRALELKPDFTDAHDNLLFTLNYNASYLPSYCLEEAIRYGSMLTSKAGWIFSSWPCSAAPDRLRIGLVSGDLCNHPVGYFLESLLSRFDRSQVELFAYPTIRREDSLTARIRPYFAAWKPLSGLDDDAAASLIHADGVHLLFDLSGHTAHNRLPVFARRPSPVQVSWLGYLATTGVQEIDYVLGDPVATPPDDQGNFSEQIWRLPDVWCCFTPPEMELEAGPLPALSAGYVTFGCFNNLSKMNDKVVALWSRLLQAVPASRLFLKAKQLGDPTVCEATLKRFAAEGIDSSRLLLEGPSPRAELLAAYQRVDIALDPFPYGGGTTTFEALWMAVPVITLKGDRFLSRCGQSLASSAGLPEWIAEDESGYVARGVAHSSDLTRLAALRGGLRQQVLASPLFDASRFAGNFEAAVRGMWNSMRNSCSE